MSKTARLLVRRDQMKRAVIALTGFDPSVETIPDMVAVIGDAPKMAITCLNEYYIARHELEDMPLVYFPLPADAVEEEPGRWHVWFDRGERRTAFVPASAFTVEAIASAAKALTARRWSPVEAIVSPLGATAPKDEAGLERAWAKARLRGPDDRRARILADARLELGLPVVWGAPPEKVNAPRPQGEDVTASLVVGGLAEADSPEVVAQYEKIKGRQSRRRNNALTDAELWARAVGAVRQRKKAKAKADREARLAAKVAKREAEAAAMEAERVRREQAALRRAEGVARTRRKDREQVGGSKRVALRW